MPVVDIDTGEITDWDSFHGVFARTLGFPHFYGRNMNAWIDCLVSADAAGHGMISTEFVARDGDILTLRLKDAEGFARRCPEQYAAVVECAAYVNASRLGAGERAIVALAFGLD